MACNCKLATCKSSKFDKVKQPIIVVEKKHKSNFGDRDPSRSLQPCTHNLHNCKCKVVHSSNSYGGSQNKTVHRSWLKLELCTSDDNLIREQQHMMFSTSGSRSGLPLDNAVPFQDVKHLFCRGPLLWIHQLATLYELHHLLRALLWYSAHPQTPPQSMPA